MREKYGEQPRGKHLKTKILSSSDSEHDGWSLRKTGKLIGQPISLISEDIQLARALKQYPELEKQNVVAIDEVKIFKY